MQNPLREMIDNRKKGEKFGVPSYCTGNQLVLETALERGKKTGMPVLIEATANQVNQYGGYTGMTPNDFRELVYGIGEKIHLSREKIILGGDHLGPLLWQKETEQTAMEQADRLVRDYVKAGFSKIHLDTSMNLGDDDPDTPLETEVIARRGAALYRACMEAYGELTKEQPDAVRPVFIIGSEVPVPGGAQEAEEGIQVTSPEDFNETVHTYQKVFREQGLEGAWEDIIGIVVQPGVEFGDSQVFYYDRTASGQLCDSLREYPGLVFEGHSTDYQKPECLKAMNEDGIAILKVGPALTFGLREGLFSLSMIEKEIVPEAYQARFIDVLEETMLEKAENWKKHYHGNSRELALARKYSYSDRCRYYMGEEEVSQAMERLFRNLTKHPVPMSMLHQYMPKQYNKVRDGKLPADPRALVKDKVAEVMEDYEFGAGYKR